MEPLLKGQVALVTAASKGLGFATALRLAEEGAQLAICSRDEKRIYEAAEKIKEKTGHSPLSLQVDVSNKEDVEMMVRKTIDQYGRIDMLLLNAGGPPAGSFMDLKDEDWEKAFATNVMSVVRTIREVVPYMRKQGGGRVVAIASSSVRVPIKGLILSNVMRTGVAGLIKTLSMELGPDGILLNTLCPGRVATDRLDELDQGVANKLSIPVEQVREEIVKGIPLRRYGKPEEFAEVALFLLSPRNTYVTGSVLMVDGGMVQAL
jgi:3-oxoacyl-[acyl-carrier protein] reductase